MGWSGNAKESDRELPLVQAAYERGRVGYVKTRKGILFSVAYGDDRSRYGRVKTRKGTLFGVAYRNK